MEHPHVSETPVSDGDAQVDVAADRLKLVRKLSFNDIYRMLTIAMVLLIPSFLLLQRGRAAGGGISSH